MISPLASHAMKAGRIATGLGVLAGSCWLAGCGGGGGGGGGQAASTSPPTVASVSPALGPLAGGFQVTVTGSGFTGATQVLFGVTPGANVRVTSDTSLTVFAPPGGGTVDVRVSTPAGQSKFVVGDGFSYQSHPGSYAFNYTINPPGNPSLSGLVIDSTGKLYVACPSFSRAQSQVDEFDPFGNYLAEVGSYGTGIGQFVSMNAVAVDAANNLYVGDAFRVEKFNSAGVFQSQSNASSISYAVITIAADASGKVYMGEADANVFNGNLEVFDATGKLLFGTRLTGIPVSLAVGANGNIFVSNETPVDGKPSGLTELNSAGTQISQSTSEAGEGIALDSAGNVYVSQVDHVSKFDSKGNLLTRFGSAGTGNGQFTAAGQVAVGPNGNVYVIDHPDFTSSSTNAPYRVEVFTPQ